MRNVVYKPLALEDVLEQATYIAQDSQQAGHQFLLSVEEVCTRVAEMPFMGALYVPLLAALEGVRHIRVPGFHNHWVFYRVTGGEIVVLRLLHSARDIDHLEIE